MMDEILDDNFDSDISWLDFSSIFDGTVEGLDDLFSTIVDGIVDNI